jgi:HEAT repeat protein
LFQNRLIWKSAAVLALFATMPGVSRAAEEAASPELTEMIVDLLRNDDRDMRALGLQQIREEVRGEANTLKFAALLASLKPDAQVGLLEALGDRGDAAARPAVLEMLRNDDLLVRCAALRSLGSLATAADVPLLAGKATSEVKEEAAAAQNSLARLRGADVNPAILAAMKGGDANVRAALLPVLAARNAKDAVPSVLELARDKPPEVRLAALRALRSLAAVADTAALVELVRQSSSAEERRHAELAISTLCGRNRGACVEPILAGWQAADPAARVVLLRALARAGGPRALEAIVAQLNSEQEVVRIEAQRAVCEWPDAAAVPHLVRLLETAPDLRGRVLAVRGLARLAGPQPDHAADLQVLDKVASHAGRAQEKRIVLSVLQVAPSTDALRLVVPMLDDKEVAPEAHLATVMIAEKLASQNDPAVTEALNKVTQQSADAALVSRAQKLLNRP